MLRDVEGLPWDSLGFLRVSNDFSDALQDLLRIFNDFMGFFKNAPGCSRITLGFFRIFKGFKDFSDGL